MGSAYGGNANSYWKTYIEWSVNNGYSATQAQIGVSLYMYFFKAEPDGADMSYNSTSYVQVGSATAGISSSWNHAPSAGQYVYLGGYTFTINKSHTTSAYGVYGVLGRSSGRSRLQGSSTASGTEYVSPKTNYAIQYNANGGTGTIANSTKWYNETLTLSDGTGFTWAHHTLTGWNTAADGTGTHYDLGSSYTANAGTTLYAEWKLNAVNTGGKVNGAWKNGILYAKVNGTWVIPYMGYGKVNGSWKEIKE